MTYTITKNPTFGSVEISFSEKPAAAVRDALKALRFRWHKKNSVWYGYTTEEAARAAVAGAIDGTATEDAPAETPASSAAQTPRPSAVNACGVQIGDVFRLTFGYDETHVSFFQVREIVGSSSVRVVEITPEIVNTEPGGMSASYTANISRDPRPADTRSIFVKDQQRGDLKRTTKCGERVQIKVDSHHAYLIEPGMLRYYESLYA